MSFCDECERRFLKSDTIHTVRAHPWGTESVSAGERASLCELCHKKLRRRISESEAEDERRRLQAREESDREKADHERSERADLRRGYGCLIVLAIILAWSAIRYYS